MSGARPGKVALEWVRCMNEGAETPLKPHDPVVQHPGTRPGQDTQRGPVSGSGDHHRRDRKTLLMTPRIIRPKAARGYLHLAHPAGCTHIVENLWARVPTTDTAAEGRRPVALIIGSSGGFGLAAIIAGLARYRISGVGLCLEKAPSEHRTGTAGWYRTAATSRLAEQAGADMAFVNADAFADTTKTDLLNLLDNRYGPIDHLIYSVASPRRTDPVTGATYTTVIKPIGDAYRTKSTIFVGDGTAELKEIEVAPAEGDDVQQTVKVMGGEDWARWVDALAARNLLSPGFATVALSYIGPELSASIYRKGTIGAAKKDLEKTACMLNTQLKASCNGLAFTCINGAAVTQAATVFPGVGLYVGLLRAVMGEAMTPPITQLTHLWDQITHVKPMSFDALGRLRLDTWELAEDVQAAVTDRWNNVTRDNINDLADMNWFLDEVRRLFGWSVPGIDYDQPTDPDVPWPTI